MNKNANRQSNHTDWSDKKTMYHINKDSWNRWPINVLTRGLTVTQNIPLNDGTVNEFFQSTSIKPNRRVTHTLKIKNNDWHMT